MEPARAVERVAAICRDFGVASLSPQVEACRELLRGGGVVDVAVPGQFKAGKSSFLNGLIGVADVPVDVLPATAGARAEEIRVALEELTSLESAIS